jgi:hypothetical protein
MSLYRTVPATKTSPGNITAALALHSRDASRILRAAGYAPGVKAKPGPKHWAGALAREPRQSENYRAAWRLLCVRQCRDALAAGNAEVAAFAAYHLAETYGREMLDGFEKPIRHVARLYERQKEKRGPARLLGVEAAAMMAREALPRATAKELWRWLRERAGAGGFQAGGCALVLPDDSTRDEIVHIDKTGKARPCKFDNFKNHYSPPKQRRRR